MPPKKSRPMKKKGATAGLPKPNTDRSSPVGTNFPGELENEDYCSCCSGSGELVCCDGCTRSFHYICADPPVDKTKLATTADWFCNVCSSRRARQDSAPRRLFDKPNIFEKLLARIEKRNPEAFGLPQDVRERFENVKTGTDGEYEEIAPAKAKSRQPGWDEAPDHFKLKDAKGNAILCHQCNQLASYPDRAILPCHFCHLSWHMDCINPPMSKEPTMGKPFRCPAHVDDILTAIPANLWPAHRFRKIKGAKPILIDGLRRMNNGYIEIENNPESADDGVTFTEITAYGQTYKLPEDSIKLNFIEQVRRKYGHLPRPDRSPKRQKTSHSPQQSWEKYNLNEQQAAINLTSVAQQTNTYRQDSANLLIQTLLNAAPENVVALMAQGTPDDWAKVGTECRKLTSANTQALLAMKHMIDQKLKASEEASSDDQNGDAPSRKISASATPAVGSRQATPATDNEAATSSAAVEMSNEATIETATEQEAKPAGSSEVADNDTPDTAGVKTPETLAVKTPTAEKDVEPEKIADDADSSQDLEMLV